MGRAINVLVVAAIALFFSACNGDGRMDERGPTVWVIDGRNIQVDRTYFRIETANNLAFVVEWTCTECALKRRMSDEEALAKSRPVLWFAVEKGEATRTSVVKFGGARLPTRRLTGIVSYQVEGKPQQNTIVVDELNVLFDWTWIIDGKSYRIFGPGYYFDENAQKLYFTMRWHDRALCEQLNGITDERAGNLAMPLLKEITSRKLFKFIPRVGIPANGSHLSTHEVDFVGIEIGCPDPACAGAINCPARGYRVARTLAQITGAP